jgi:integrase
LFLLNTGCRPGEACAICPEHVNLDEHKVVLPQHKNSRCSGKPRTIYLNDQALFSLPELLFWAEPGRPLFRNTVDRPWSTRKLDEYWRELRDRLGLPEDCRLLGARHRFITNLHKRGVPTATVAVLVGHEGIWATQTYVHVEGDDEHLLAVLNGG